MTPELKAAAPDLVRRRIITHTLPGLFAAGFLPLTTGQVQARLDGCAASVVVLLNDCSSSNNKYDVIVKGTGEAFMREDVIAKIEQINRLVGPVIVLDLDFSSPSDGGFLNLNLVQRIPPRVLRNADDSRALGRDICALSRPPTGHTHTAQAVEKTVGLYMRPLMQCREKAGCMAAIGPLIGPNTEFVLDVTADDPSGHPVINAEGNTMSTDYSTAEAVVKGHTIDDPRMQAVRSVLEQFGIVGNIIVFGGTTGNRAHPMPSLPVLKRYYEHNLKTSTGRVWVAARPEDFAIVIAQKIIMDIAANGRVFAPRPA